MHDENYLIYSMIYMIYIMILNIYMTHMSIMTIIIQRHLWNNFQLKYEEMNMYLITCHEKHET